MGVRGGGKVGSCAGRDGRAVRAAIAPITSKIPQRYLQGMAA